jgi:hypothetical protein
MQQKFEKAIFSCFFDISFIAILAAAIFPLEAG